ncbi:Glyoxysomal fatty acid beta-oxidation multifunctional protein MFP-a [Auxenochlorella protothecoides]|uniref:Glyoxysomal fatty acid beta-oxidation multifunctional protein MFP-a n=1 Tax=Auxenochlorella protothecoides TaxID=3075 RepID=A0A087SJ24_AUXPR|nr:Glyoxysomal fatty acid beta-oxidation multifunctional protein MFP-a [Auxenochlorella protothecoides]KFM25728.1 Glyoxysomal fatty acid beta-oxidation multifunctional protein MFP-a [Auxenochlorella protothecoides]RMZ57179.1 hypothetical protein APUTEX25_004013 [Auxenochlorella protothecoides]|eukprot:RMZ57179.1 hypothetical protein APUTEX25_004013 [Auxenochlorella protothecoides]
MSEPESFSLVGLEVVDGVAIISLQNPPVNALHPDVLNGLFKTLERCNADPDVAAFVITGSSDIFSAGMDINLLRQPGLDVASGRPAAVANLRLQLEEAAKPSVAAVTGSCLGGGLELALACTARVAAHDARLGLPEVRLGLCPGLGGTQRLPRLVGLQPALRLILSGAAIGAAEAATLGLVDEVAVAGGALVASASRLARELAAAPDHPLRGRGSLLERDDRLPPPAEAEELFAAARDKTARQWVNLRSTLLCLDAVQYGVAHGGRAGEDKEGECFGSALALDSHRALLRAFFAHRAALKARGPRRVRLWVQSLWARLAALLALLLEWWRLGARNTGLRVKEL